MGMVSSGTPFLSAAAFATLLLVALASAEMAANSCFEEYAIGRLYRTKYEVCKGDNNSKCKCTVPLLLLARVLLHVMYRVASVAVEKLLLTLN